MSMQNPYNQYLETQIMTATPARLLVLTYDAGIRFGRIALEKMKENNFEEKNTNIKKAQNALLQLMGSLNHDVDAKLTGDLESIYSYLFDKLTRANICDDQDALMVYITTMTELRSGWAQAEMKINQENMQQEALAA